MRLEELFKNVIVKNDFSHIKNIEIKNIAFDTRDVLANCLFFCLKGANTDGHIFLQPAYESGAVVAVIESYDDNVDIPQVVVECTRRALSIVCANFYNNPQHGLKMVAVVGTNGKTSTTQILRHIFMHAKKNVAAIGTLGYYINEERYDLNLTTPDPTQLFKLLYDFRKKGVEYVFMEVSAHAIWHEKVYGINFEIAALTNISQDHLDFFKTMENYSKTKIDFLKSLQIKTLVLNADDSYFSKFYNTEAITYGIKAPADSFALDIVLGLGKTSYALNLLDNILLVKTKLSGEFNVYNALCAGTISLLLGISPAHVKNGLNTIDDIDGRFNVITTDKGVVVLDFAHTPDSLKNVLATVQKTSNFRDIVCVFGASGNKDVSKRKFMGKIGEEYCKRVILTSDEPRFENIRIIFDDILQLVEQKNKFLCIEDRKKAIEVALTYLNDETIIVICGKAGESFDDINGVKVPYKEEEVVKDLMEKLHIKLT